MTVGSGRRRRTRPFRAPVGRRRVHLAEPRGRAGRRRRRARRPLAPCGRVDRRRDLHVHGLQDHRPAHEVLAALGTCTSGDLFRNTTTNGGDMGAHVWWPWFLEHNWFPKLRLSGWAPDWYAGFPVGQYYFPVPALMVALLNIGDAVQRRVQARDGERPAHAPGRRVLRSPGACAPRGPAPPAFAIAAFGMLVQERTDWTSTAATSRARSRASTRSTIALAFALFALGALAYTLDTGKRRWLPAVLIARGGHVAHRRRDLRGGRGAPAVARAPAAPHVADRGRGRRRAAWRSPRCGSLPLLGQQAYTQSMRYAKVFSTGSSFQLPHWVFLPEPGEAHDRRDRARRVAARHDASGKLLSPTLWLPWWIWMLAGVAIVAAGWYRRRSTLVLLLIAGSLRRVLRQWPEHAVWNTRFLPFWLLTWGVPRRDGRGRDRRASSPGSSRGRSRGSRDGDLAGRSAHARGPTSRSTTTPDVPTRAPARKPSGCSPTGSSTRDPPGWEPPRRPRSRPCSRGALASIGAVALATLVVVACVFGMRFAWSARNGNPNIRDRRLGRSATTRATRSCRRGPSTARS